MDRCIGKGNYHKSNTTEWYGFYDKATTADTRCAYCANYLKEAGLGDNLFKMHTHYSHIDCDSWEHDEISSMVFKNFIFSVVSADKTTPFLVHQASKGTQKDGVVVVEMPKQAKYAIKISPITTSSIRWGLRRSRHRQNDPEYFTFEVMIGDRKVIVNNNDTTYYEKDIYITGFESGKNESFQFVSDTVQSVQTDESKHDSLSNVISIKINRFKHEKPMTFKPLGGFSVTLQLIHVDRTMFELQDVITQLALIDVKEIC
jgi:hypothetical protein